MAEVNVEAEAKADAAFATGFGDTPPAPVEKVVAETPAEPAKPAAAVPAADPAPKPVKPQYARVLQQDWDNLKAAAGKVANLESQIAKLAGNAPDAERIAQQVIEKVRGQTPAGLNVEFSDEDFAELAEYAPELAGLTRTTLEKLFKKANVKGTGPAEAEPAKPADPASPDAIKKAIADAFSQREQEALAKAHPNWSDDVGRPKEDGLPNAAGKPFRDWLATQPADYQKEVGETDSWPVVHAALDKFKASQKPAATPASAQPDKAAARRAVIADAETPRAEGNPPPLNQPESAEDAFGKAFKATKH